MQLYAGGKPLDMGIDTFGFLTESQALLGDSEQLQERFRADGYLFLRDFLPRHEVEAVRLRIAQRLHAEGLLHPEHPVEDCVANPAANLAFRPDIGNTEGALHDLIYSPNVMAFFSDLLGDQARHYDFTWLRVVSPGNGTNPHCDIVYMGRGTQNIRTMWVPFGDVPVEVGGLLLLENSHRHAEFHAHYGRLDVDARCENKPDMNQVAAEGYEASGAIDNDFLALQRRFGGRWLTANFRMGDVLIFGMSTIHGSLDNGSNRIRISSDSRYQLSADPIDERWVGDHPIAHGSSAKVGLIC